MDFSGRHWRKSSYSGSNGTDCVEIAIAPDPTAVRDSKNPDGAILVFEASPWSDFLASAHER